MIEDVGATAAPPRATFASLPWWLLAPLLAGGLIRFAALGHQSFWNDEIATLTVLHRPFSGLPHAVRLSESTPPLYYVLAWPWARVFGFGEAGLRSLSALFGTATIAALALVARAAAGPRAGAAAGWFAATSPALVWYSQEARAYSLLALLSAVSLGCMLWARRDPKASSLAAWTLSGVALAATHYFGGFLIAGELCVLAARPGAALRRAALVAPALAFAAAAIPLGLLASSQSANTGFVQGRPLPRALAESAGQLLVGYGVDWVMVLCGVAAAAGVGVCLWALALRSPARRELAVVAVAAALAVAAPVVIALAGHQLIDARNVLFLVPVLALLAGTGAAVGERTLWAVALAVVAGLIVVVHVFADPTFERTDYRGAARAIGPASQPRAILARLADVEGLEQYLPGLRPLGPHGTDIGQIAVIGMSTHGGLNRNVEPLAGVRFAAPPGFQQVQARAAETFTLRRYQAPQPVRVTLPELVARAGGQLVVLIQR